MSTALWALLGSLVGVAIIHTRTRLGGAFAAIVWTSCALVFGVQHFEVGERISFLRVATPPWLYVVALLGLIGFNVAVIARIARKRRATGTTPG
jgi:hypothetical protein